VSIVKINTARIITIGSELLRGEVINSNAADICRTLQNRGIKINYIVTLPDDMETAEFYLKSLLSRPGIYLFTGGLGGTRDDITRQVVCGVLGRKLIVDREKKVILEQYYRSHKRKFSILDEMQASFPEGGRLLANNIGLAYGFYIKTEGRFIFALPGVPTEMRSMFYGEVLPTLGDEGLASGKVQYQVLSFTNIPEYTLDRKVQGIVQKYGDIQYGTQTQYGIIKVWLESHTTDIERPINEIMAELNENYIAPGDRNLEEIVGALLLSMKLKLSLAESCTGGLLSKKITDIPGSAEYFSGSIVSYSNEIKESLLGVNRSTLIQYGAVSGNTAREMASKALKKFGSEIAIAITGIAGPGGGSSDKPVGTVYICLHTKDAKSWLVKNEFSGDRETIRKRSVNKALWMLFHYLTEIKP
jgi:nicotinamide-nucleotide amidase